MINDEADKVIEELFKSLQNTYQNKLEKSMKGSKFVFDNKKYMLRMFQKIIQIV